MPCRILIVLTLLLVAACAGSPNSPDNNTTARNTHPNRVYFCLDTTDGHIVIPVYVNDTVAATVLFDTGAAPGFILDSAFVKTHYLTPAVAPEKEDVHIPFVYEKKVLSLQYHCPMPLKIGNTVVNNSVLNVFDLSQGGLHAVDGVVTIPSEDTVHIWEVNFEKNYLEIHDSRHFQMPENCRWHPLIYMNNACLIEMPLQIIHNGDTLRSNYLYWIDTGVNYMDILISPTMREARYFDKYGENHWRTSDGGITIYKENKVNATAWGNINIDSLRFYTYTIRKSNPDVANLGNNFLKRFNVFFDLKNRRLGLQPIIYRRSANPHERSLYYYVDTTPTARGTYKINFIPDFKANYYKAAGLQTGDEIISWNGYPYSDILNKKVIPKNVVTDTIVYKIIRNNKPMEIIVSEPKE